MAFDLDDTFSRPEPALCSKEEVVPTAGFAKRVSKWVEFGKTDNRRAWKVQPDLRHQTLGRNS